MVNQEFALLLDEIRKRARRSKYYKVLTPEWNIEYFTKTVNKGFDTMLRKLMNSKQAITLILSMNSPLVQTELLRIWTIVQILTLDDIHRLREEVAYHYAVCCSHEVTWGDR